MDGAGVAGRLLGGGVSPRPGTTLFLGDAAAVVLKRSPADRGQALRQACHQSNTLVMRPGRYHFRDYRKLELPHSLILGVGASLIALLWPLGINRSPSR